MSIERLNFFKNLLVVSNQKHVQKPSGCEQPEAHAKRPAQLVSWSQILFGTSTAQRLRRSQLSPTPPITRC